MMKFAMNTNAIRDLYSVRELVRIAKDAGAEALEWGLGPLDQAEKEAVEAKKAAEEAGMQILSFLNAGPLWKTDEIRRWSDAVKAGGAHILRVAHPWFAWDYNESVHQADDFMRLVELSQEGLARLMDLGKEYDIRYVLETHSASCFASPLMVPWILKEFDPEYCGVIYDPANTLIEGFIRPRAAVEIMKEYIAYLHIKNIAFTEKKDENGKSIFGRQRRTVDNGMLDYTELMFALKLHHWDGWGSFEEFTVKDADGVIREIRSGIEHIKRCYAEAKDAIEEPYLPFNN